MRLIDAYALQDKIHKSKMQNPHKDAKTAKNHEFEHDHFMQLVVLQPTAQEEIVRCKDCTYRGEINCPQYYRRTELSDNYFCADGRKEWTK